MLMGLRINLTFFLIDYISAGVVPCHFKPQNLIILLPIILAYKHQGSSYTAALSAAHPLVCAQSWLLIGVRE